MLLSGFVAVTNSNVLAGSLFEFIKRPSRVSVATLADAALNAGNTFTFIIGDVAIARDAQVFGGALTTSGQAEHLRFPDDFLIQNEPALPGDRLVFAIARAAGNIMWAVIITEVA